MKKGQTFKLIVMIVIGAVVIYNIVQLIRPNAPEVKPEQQIATPIVVQVAGPESPEKKEIKPEEKVGVINVIINSPEPQPEPVAPIVIAPPVVEVVVEAPVEPEPEPELIVTAPIMTELEIISPIAKKGLGREYTAQPEIVDESNYIELGLVVRDGSGNVVKDAEVVITATDAEQNKILNGTGNITKIYKNGVPEAVNYYPFHYEFRSTGTHTITFKVGDVETSVDLTVTEPDPA